MLSSSTLTIVHLMSIAASEPDDPGDRDRDGGGRVPEGGDGRNSGESGAEGTPWFL
jgi:hypothetical protein